MKSAKGVALHPALAAALKKKPRLLAAFQRMRPSCHRQYSDWVGMAKDAAARTKRITGILEEVRRWDERNPAKAALIKKIVKARIGENRLCAESKQK